jgi:tRNA pseudouridine38-40 synthase
MNPSDRDPQELTTHNIRLLVAYDGTDFRGLAPNRGVRTVVGELVRVLEPLMGREPDIVMSGRTDAGVHAWGQVLSFTVDAEGWADLERRGGLARIQRSVNSRLGPEVVVRDVVEVPAEFSARFSATGRRYRYLVVNRDVPDPFLARTAWWVGPPLAVEAMQVACPQLVGEHDFSSFCRRPRTSAGARETVASVSHPEARSEPADVSMVRRVTGARWLDMSSHLGEGVLRFDIEGSAFCHQMVRSIVGFLVAVGSGKRRAGELPAVLAARDRSRAENPAPPHGLTLWQVDYG